MKKAIFLLCLTSALTITLLIPSTGYAKNDKSEVCHIPRANPYKFHTLLVGGKALENHLAHGDSTGACNPTVICDDGNLCTVDVDPRTNKCLGQNRPAVYCEDGNLCTNDSCNPSMGCINEVIECDNPDECTTSACNPSDGTCRDSAVDCDPGEICQIGSGCVPEGPSSSCVVANGLTWCFNAATCGEACNDVCASQGLTPVANDMVWLEAQSTRDKCIAISQAFGLGTEIVTDFDSENTFTFGCVQDGLTGIDSLQAPLFCSRSLTCPLAHRTGMDSQGVACGEEFARRSICPCE